MRHMHTVDVPETTREVLDRITCDLCGETITTGGLYEVDEVEVRHKTGENYPEGGSGEEKKFDLCGHCFDSKLVPWLKSRGAEARIEEWDW